MAKTIRAFSCGRGVHRFFVGGILPTHTGWIVYTRPLRSNRIGIQELRDLQAKLPKIASFEVVKLSFWGRISAMFSKRNHADSMYFSETTKAVESDINSNLEAA